MPVLSPISWKSSLAANGVKIDFVQVAHGVEWRRSSFAKSATIGMSVS